MATVLCALRSLAPLAVGLALCTGPRAVNAQDLIEPEYETLLDEVNVSGDVFLGIMTGKSETEVRPDGPVMHVYVWIPEERVADSTARALCVRIQSIDGLYEAALSVSADTLKKLEEKDKPGRYHLAYETRYKNEFGVRHANEVAIHAFWSENCEAPGDSVLVATWDRASAYPHTIWLLLNNPEGRALLGEQRCRSLEAVDRTLIAYDKVCEAVLTDSTTQLKVHRWDGIEFQAIKTINLERPVDHAEPAWTASPPDSSP